MNLDLLEKYNVPVPRYTSYPTVPFWQKGIDVQQWKQVFTEEFLKNNLKEGISLYIHLPFCESLCTYCGCNKKITTNHAVEAEYIETIGKEWKMYRQLMKEPPIIRELHLGGGTPTFFTAKNLALLFETIVKRSIIHPRHEFSIEGHPNNTTKKHLDTLYSLGFRRISFGVQDNDEDVQRIINRLQPFENLKRATEDARNAGFKSINFDLIYGLPRQTPESIRKTITQVLQLKPDRVAFYSYAHVPWTSRGQRLFDEKDLPTPEQKLNFYKIGKEIFLQSGYHDVGMDHFALRSDDLFKAHENGELHRNFMGYTTQKTSLLLGLGVSSISDTGNAFGQNEKALHDYYESIKSGRLPISRGYFLSEEDLAFRKYILDISCRGKTSFREEDMDLLQQYSFPELKKLAADELVEWNRQEVIVMPRGKQFIRNVCKAFDLQLLRNQTTDSPLFSKAV